MTCRVLQAMLLSVILSLVTGCEPGYGGRACTSDADCDDLEDRSGEYQCSPLHAFTCQARCDPCDAPSGWCCPDGSDCPVSADFDYSCPGLAAIVPQDTCDVSGAGCEVGWVCRLTLTGVRRCMESGCRPEDGLCLRSDWRNRDPRTCLPDPEDAGAFVCWLGGRLETGPCASSYECLPARACGPDGLCRPACAAVEDCASHPGTVCRDFVCVPE